MECLLSILIPVYNAASNLANLVASVMVQCQDNVEVILLNDGSTDNSLSIACDLKKRYLEKIQLITRNNKGTVYTRRELFRAAKGQWIWIVDSDDQIEDGALTFLLEKISDTNADMLLFDYYQIESDRKQLYHQLDVEDGTVFSGAKKLVLYKEIISGDRINSLWSKVFRRTCIDINADYSMYENVRRANDKLQLLPIITSTSSVVYLRRPLYCYHVVSGSLCHSFNDYTTSSLLMVYSRMNEYLDNWGTRDEMEPFFCVYIIENVCQLIEQYVWYKSIDLGAVEQYITSLFANPVVYNGFMSVDLKSIDRRYKKLYLLLEQKKIKNIARYIKIMQFKSCVNTRLYDFLIKPHNTKGGD